MGLKMKKKPIGFFFKNDLSKIVKEESSMGDYDFFDRFAKEWGVYKDLKSTEKMQDLEAVFFLYYPFNKVLAEKLVPYENNLPFINKPSGVLKTSEKTFELENLKDFCPLTKLITKKDSYNSLETFAKNFDTVVIKPIDGTGGRGIYFLDNPYKEEDILKLQELGKKNSGRYLLQEYVPNKGDKRIICYNGVVLGGFGRQSENSRIHNMSGGGKLTEFKPSAIEIKIAQDVSSMLKNQGVFLSGLDLINDKLIEVNTAMPGGLMDMTPYKFKSLDEAYVVFREETKKIIKDYK